MTDWIPGECSNRCHGTAHWHLHNFDIGGHSVMRESTTGTVVCGESWCSGKCGFPALVLRTPALDPSILDKMGAAASGEPTALKAYGSMVAIGLIWQVFRSKWAGAMVDATLGPTTVENALKRHWL